MKKIYALFLMAMLVSMTACADDEDFGAINVSTSRCKGYQYAPTRTASVEEGEWIDYSVTKREDGLYLHIVHENIYLNCAATGAECTAKIEGNVITMDERETFYPSGLSADCICPYDVTYDVGPLKEGDYTLVITFRNLKIAEMAVHVDNPLRGRFNVDAFITKIENATLANVQESEIVYDLLGRCYASFPFPGVFIKGGKKIVWKGE